MFDFIKKKNRTLTLESIKSLDDIELNTSIFEDIDSKIEKGSNNAIHPAQTAFFAMRLVENEVNNGGFNQFYFNKNPMIAELAIEGFKIYGAPKFSELIKESFKIFNSIKDDLKKYNDGTAESFSKSYDNNPLNNLDKKFQDLYKEENLEKISAKFIRTHPEAFL